MGANFCVREYATKDKGDAQRRWAGDVEKSTYDYGHSYSGDIGMLGPDVEFVLESFPTAGECERWIMEKHEKWDPPLGVEFSGGWVVGGWCSS
jgi:hypothetical protein